MPSDLPSSVTRPKHQRGKIIITADTSPSGTDGQLDPDGGWGHIITVLLKDIKTARHIPGSRPSLSADCGL